MVSPLLYGVFYLGFMYGISDVKNSTAAVSAGKHYEVDLVAAGSLIAGLKNVGQIWQMETFLLHNFRQQ